MCNLCGLSCGEEEQHKTRWYFLSPFEIVCEDLNPKNAAMRLLYVPARHVKEGHESHRTRMRAIEILKAIGKVIALENGWTMGEIGMNNHSVKDHWHAQLSLYESCTELSIEE